MALHLKGWPLNIMGMNVIYNRLKGRIYNLEIFDAVWRQELVHIYNSEFSVPYSQTVQAGRSISVILSSFLRHEETEAPGYYYLVCERSQSWFVAAFSQSPVLPFPAWHSAPFVLNCSFNFSLS